MVSFSFSPFLLLFYVGGERATEGVSCCSSPLRGSPKPPPPSQSVLHWWSRLVPQPPTAQDGIYKENPNRSSLREAWVATISPYQQFPPEVPPFGLTGTSPSLQGTTAPFPIIQFPSKPRSRYISNSSLHGFHILTTLVATTSSGARDFRSFSEQYRGGKAGRDTEEMRGKAG